MTRESAFRTLPRPNAASVAVENADSPAPSLIVSSAASGHVVLLGPGDRRREASLPGGPACAADPCTGGRTAIVLRVPGAWRARVTSGGEGTEFEQAEIVRTVEVPRALRVLAAARFGGVDIVVRPPVPRAGVRVLLLDRRSRRLLLRRDVTLRGGRARLEVPSRLRGRALRAVVHYLGPSRLRARAVVATSFRGNLRIR